jgi:hypothetical protein
MVNSEELIGTTEYLTLQTRCRIKQCYNRVVRHYTARLQHSFITTQNIQFPFMTL